MSREVKSCLMIGLLGLVALIMGLIGLGSDHSNAVNNTETATATVVSWETEDEYDNVSETYQTNFYPVLCFQAGSETVEARYSQCFSSEVYDIGEGIAVNYDPDNPESFNIAGEKRGTFSAMWAIPLGMILLIFAVVKCCILRRKKQEEA